MIAANPLLRELLPTNKRLKNGEEITANQPKYVEWIQQCLEWLFRAFPGIVVKKNLRLPSLRIGRIRGALQGWPASFG